MIKSQLLFRIMLYCYIVTVIVKYFNNSVVLLYSNSNSQLFLYIIMLYCYIVTVIVKYFNNSVVLLYSNSNSQLFL